MKKTLATLSILLVTLSACGSDGDSDSKGDSSASESPSASDSADETTAKANLKAAFLKDASMLGATTDEQADCVANGMVDTIGLEKLQEYELITADLDFNSDSTADPKMEASDADDLAQVFVGCIDITEVLASQFSQGGADLTDEQQACLKDAIDPDAVADMMSATFQGIESDVMTDMQTAMLACIK